MSACAIDGDMVFTPSLFSRWMNDKPARPVARISEIRIAKRPAGEPASPPEIHRDHEDHERWDGLS